MVQLQKYSKYIDQLQIKNDEFERLKIEHEKENNENAVCRKRYMENELKMSDENKRLKRDCINLENQKTELQGTFDKYIADKKADQEKYEKNLLTQKSELD